MLPQLNINIVCPGKTFRKKSGLAFAAGISKLKNETKCLGRRIHLDLRAGCNLRDLGELTREQIDTNAMVLMDFRSFRKFINIVNKKISDHSNP